MTDRLDEAKRLHAEPPCVLTWWADEMQRSAETARGIDHPHAKVIADGNEDLACVLRNAAALAEAAEWVVKAFEPIDDDTMSFLHDLKNAVDRVRGRKS